MSSSARLGAATRAFFIATVLGLALAFQEPRVVQATMFLLVVAGAASALEQMSLFAPRWLCLVEGLFAALLIGVTLPGGAMLLPYLMVPALLVGVTGSIRAVVMVSGIEMFALILMLLGPETTSFQQAAQVAAPWSVASLGAGLMAVWVLQLRGQTPHGEDEASYESARRLLSQLRTVAKRLSSGLDPVSISTQVLGIVSEQVRPSVAGVFVRTEGGVLAPLGYQGFGAQEALLPEGVLVDRCWREMQPLHEAQPVGRANRRHRIVLPLRSGPRMIGLVIAEAKEAPAQEDLLALASELDEHALRLDTALVFDEVRSLATMEERQRLAREIHDGVAQEIASLGYYVDELSDTAFSELQRAKLQTLRGEITRVVSELRMSIFDLRSDITTAGGLGSALSDYVRAVGARSGLTVHLTLDEAATRLRPEVETELLRIAQEAVTNARKHSHARNLWVDCRVHPPLAEITIRDDGTGLGAARPDSYGLSVMRERADRIGATLDVHSHGTTRNGTSGTTVSVMVGVPALAEPLVSGREVVG